MEQQTHGSAPTEVSGFNISLTCSQKGDLSRLPTNSNFRNCTSQESTKSKRRHHFLTLHETRNSKSITQQRGREGGRGKPARQGTNKTWKVEMQNGMYEPGENAWKCQEVRGGKNRLHPCWIYIERDIGLHFSNW